eukprot:scaffold62726_cov102-Phaeocystis_antarctica.AAC.2
MARSQVPEDYTRTQRWRARAKTSLLGRRWLHPSGSTRPWLVPGVHVVAVGGSPGDRVGESVSHSSLASFWFLPELRSAADVLQSATPGTRQRA